MVACVVLNWNGWQDTVACLRTLQTQTWQPLHVIVVDNGSTNESVSKIWDFIETASGPTVFQLIEQGENGGFARGTNVGIREALRQGAKSVWLLNNDTECPPDTLAKLMRVAEARPDAGMVGTVLYYQHDPARVQAWGGGVVSRWSGMTRHDRSSWSARPGAFLTFASALVRSAVFADVGLLYEGSFLYYEDADFGLRLRKTPWTMAVAEDTAVLHREGGSADRRGAFVETEAARSGVLFLRRHSPLPWFSTWVYAALKVLNRLRRRETDTAWRVIQAIRETRRIPLP